MNMKIVVHLFVIFALNATATRAQGQTAPPAGKPNVLFIAIDDLRDWVGYLNRHPQAKTPNIDRLAARGVAFTRSYCAAPVCNPSRAALMSGLRPSTSGVYNNVTDWRTVISEDLPLTTMLRKAGYHVCGAGKIYHESFARRSEWDDYLEKRGRDAGRDRSAEDDGVGGIKFGPLDCRDDELRDWQIIDYGIEQLGKKHEKPLFLAIGLHKPHMPWFVPKKYFDLFPLESIQLPPHLESDLDDVPSSGVKMAVRSRDHERIVAAGRWKEAVQAYLAAIAYTDMNIGRLLDALDNSAYQKNTVVCFWSDHGWHLGEKKHWRKFALWEEATRAPLVWVVPGLTKAGTVCQRTVDLMSVYPTLMDICGLPIPKHVEGRSIRALLADSEAPWETAAVTTHGFKNHAIRTEQWRYIRYADGGEELYDEIADPNEWTNLAKKPELSERIAELARSLPPKDAPAARSGDMDENDEPATKRRSAKKKRRTKAQ